MPGDFIWPTEPPIIVDNVMGSDVSLLKEKFGALSQGDDLYSRICIGNSVISLEPYRGCTLRCAYCMANNDIRGLHDVSAKDSAIIRKPEKIYDSCALLDALVCHPAFIEDKTVIGFCTGSTEVFLKDVNDNVWEAMKHMVSLGLKNPIWLVVKSCGECNLDKWIRRFRFLSNHGINTIISITDAGLPSTVEPFQPESRFEPFKCLSESGVVLSHHLRPILPGISTYDSLLSALEKSKDIVSSVCIGGLRIDPGMKLFWESQEDYEYVPGNQNKELNEGLERKIRDTVTEMGLPVFLHSSEMISYHLGINDYNLNKYRTDKACFLNLGADAEHIENACGGAGIISVLQEIAHSIGLNVHFNKENGSVITVDKKLEYPELHALIQAVGHSSIFQEKIENEI